MLNENIGDDAIKRFLLPCLKIAFTFLPSVSHDLKLSSVNSTSWKQ